MTLTTSGTSTSLHSNAAAFSAVNKALKRFDYKEEGLVDILFVAQENYGYLSRSLLTYVAKELHVSLSRVFGVATFYDMFTLKPSKTRECLVCTGPSCIISGADDVLDEIYRLSSLTGPGQSSVEGLVKVVEVSCLGLCDQAPATLIEQKAQVNLTVQDVPAMMQGKAKTSRIQVSGSLRELTAPIGVLEPTDLAAHRSAGAFAALDKALHQMTAEQVIQEVTESHLTGRGGAGFSTGKKWDLARKAVGQPKYIVCNFDESEPGTFKDRVLMEGNPFRVIEGMALSGYAASARDGYIFVRGEYPEATEILEEALDKLYDANLLGKNIMGTEIDFDVEIRHNAGAYICGEETALFEALEGKRGFPRSKPPYPTQAGVFGKPTTINNVETLAIIPSLVLHGGEWFHQWGTPNSTGFKLFCLSGHVNTPGVVEAPYGVTVNNLIEQFGGGFDGEPLAVLIGGATGGFLHQDMFDTPLTHEDLHKFNVPIGSGAIMVFNNTVDLWRVLEGLAGFFVHECCGQCAPCRIGTNQIYNLLKKINMGEFSTSALQKAEKMARTIKNTCFCGLGKTAANPLLTYLQNLNLYYDLGY